MRKLVLLSGGKDSAAAAMLSGATDALHIDWGGSANVMEVAHSKRVAKDLGLIYHYAGFPALLTVPGEHVVAARNMFLVAVGANYAVSQGIGELVIGCAAADHDGFEDCRPDYLRLLSALVRPFGVELKTPVLLMGRDEISDMVKHLNTWSCYRGGTVPCGECASCNQ